MPGWKPLLLVLFLCLANGPACLPDTHYKGFENGSFYGWVTDQGQVEAWLDGNRVIDYLGPIGYNDRLGVWFKWGIYRDDHPVSQFLYHDEYRRGGSYSDVAPGSCDAS